MSLPPTLHTLLLCLLRNIVVIYDRVIHFCRVPYRGRRRAPSPDAGIRGKTRGRDVEVKAERRRAFIVRNARERHVFIGSFERGGLCAQTSAEASINIRGNLTVVTQQVKLSVHTPFLLRIHRAGSRGSQAKRKRARERAIACGIFQNSSAALHLPPPLSFFSLFFSCR